MNNRTRHFILDLQGNSAETDNLTAARWLANNDNRILYSNGPGYEVSTVFLAHDHAIPGFDKLPVLWETLAFFTLEDIRVIQRRYHTRDEAVAGHADIIREARQRVELHGHGKDPKVLS